jgi:raffinose/stachyose/melibiose transport system substrate-binding protein
LPGKRRIRHSLIGTISIIAAAGLVAACSSGGSAGSSGTSSSQSSGTFTILQFETPGSAAYNGYQAALATFKKENPGLKVNFVTTSFNSILQEAKLILNSSSIPNVIEVNKGNADTGTLVAQGLLTDLTPEVQKYGWDTVITGPMQNLARYSTSGDAGSGDWYGIPQSGQDYLLYYNADMFKKYGIPIPTTQAQIVSAMQAFEAKGITPVSANAGEFGLAQLWWQLVSAQATRAQIDNYMFLKGQTSFSAGPFAAGSAELQSWLKDGYLGKDIAALTQNQMETAFYSGKYPMMFDGSWIYAQAKAAIKFNWGTTLYPGANYDEGLTGQLWGVPAKATDKQLAYEWINLTLSPQVQNVIGEQGGLPLRSDLSAISDTQTKTFTEQFNSLATTDKLSYFPDYPVTGLLNFLESELQGMANGSVSAAQFDSALQTFYDNGQ